MESTALSAAAWTVLGLLSSGCILEHFPAKAIGESSDAYPLSATGRVELATFNGRIQVRRGDGAEVRITRTVTCRARTDMEAEEGLRRMVPEVVSMPESVAIRLSDPRTADHRFQVDLEAWVPEGARLELKTSNGAIDVAGIQGAIEAHTSNGPVAVRDGGSSPVEIETSNGKVIAEEIEGPVTARTRNGKIELRDCPGKIDAATSNGSIDIDAASGVAAEGIEARTSNGRMSCLLPENFAGDVDARTSNGKIHCEFPVTAEPGERKRSRLRGRIGAGGPALRFTTSNGPIDIRRAVLRAGEASFPPRAEEEPAAQKKPETREI